MDGRMDGQRENSIPSTNKVCRGITGALQLYSDSDKIVDI